MPSSLERAIDINADLGEASGEEPLYEIICSANIACGGHTGDDSTMREAVRLALRHGVAIGAHPSYPDRHGFGRDAMRLPHDALTLSIASQVTALERVAFAQGAVAHHVKPHGALYNDAAARSEIASAVAQGVDAHRGSIVLVGLAGSVALGVWRERGHVVAPEGFADRTYEADGTLVPRARAGAVITDPGAAAAQAVRLAEEGRCETIGIHSDTPGAAAIARAVRRALERAGFAIRPLARILRKERKI